MNLFDIVKDYVKKIIGDDNEVIEDRTIIINSAKVKRNKRNYQDLETGIRDCVIVDIEGLNNIKVHRISNNKRKNNNM